MTQEELKELLEQVESPRLIVDVRKTKPNVINDLFLFRGHFYLGDELVAELNDVLVHYKDDGDRYRAVVVPGYEQIKIKNRMESISNLFPVVKKFIEVILTDSFERLDMNLKAADQDSPRLDAVLGPELTVISNADILQERCLETWRSQFIVDETNRVSG